MRPRKQKPPQKVRNPRRRRKFLDPLRTVSLHGKDVEKTEAAAKPEPVHVEDQPKEL